MPRLADLDALAGALRGRPAPDTDWMAVLGLANQALVTPQAHAALLRTGAVERLPAEVRAFTAEVHRRNRARNRRLFAQLRDALTALNAAGIAPVLLKGAAAWLTLGRPAAFDRMMTDLDLLVGPTEAPRAIDALVGAGFAAASRYDGQEVHVVAELGRPEVDVGYVDLHQRPPGPPGLAELLRDDGRVVEWDGVRAVVPSLEAQVFGLVLHDQFHDGGYWRGGFPLRHLLDIAALTAAPAFDWNRLSSLARTELVRRALDVQLLAARDLAGAQVPAASPWAGLQHARRRAQFAWPALGLPLAALGVLSELGPVIGHRRADAADRRRLFGPQRRSAADRWSRLRELVATPAPGRV